MPMLTTGPVLRCQLARPISAESHVQPRRPNFRFVLVSGKSRRAQPIAPHLAVLVLVNRR